MKKYIRAFICLTYSLIKFSTIKIFHFKGFTFTKYSIFSPLTQIDLGKNSQLKLSKFVKSRSGVKLKVRDGAKLDIGQGTSFNHGCMVVSHDEIKIGENVQFGPNVLIYDHDHDFRTQNGLKNLKYLSSPVSIGNNVWVGANVVILRGTVIGDNCVIGAGTVIKGNFENDTIVTNHREVKCKKIN